MNASIKKLSDEPNAINAKVGEQLKSIVTDVTEYVGKTNAPRAEKRG